MGGRARLLSHVGALAVQIPVVGSQVVQRQPQGAEPCAYLHTHTYPQQYRGNTTQRLHARPESSALQTPALPAALAPPQAQRVQVQRVEMAAASSKEAAVPAVPAKEAATGAAGPKEE